MGWGACYYVHICCRPVDSGRAEMNGLVVIGGIIPPSDTSRRTLCGVRRGQ